MCELCTAIAAIDTTGSPATLALEQGRQLSEILDAPSRRTTTYSVDRRTWIATPVADSHPDDWEYCENVLVTRADDGVAAEVPDLGRIILEGDVWTEDMAVQAAIAVLRAVTHTDEDGD